MTDIPCIDQRYRKMPAGRYPVYDNIIASITDANVRRLANILVKHVGKESRISRGALAREYDGTVIDNSLNIGNNNTDRKIRVMIAELQRLGMPIISDTAEGGYWLGTREERQAYIANLLSRIQEMKDKINSLLKADEIERTAFTQGRLF